VNVGLFIAYVVAYSCAAIVVGAGVLVIGASKLLEWCIE